MKKLAVLAFAFIALVAAPAAADETSGPVRQMKEQLIVGRPAKPLAATEVGKLPMKSTLTELRQPLANRVEKPVANAPF